MSGSFWEKNIGRRGFLKLATFVGVCLPFINPYKTLSDAAGSSMTHLFWVKDIPDQPFDVSKGPNDHTGVDCLLDLMGMWGLKFYRSSHETDLSGPLGMIASNDVVLIKVNAQWKYRGCTNSDLIRGLIQKIIEHPDGFNGEVVIFENGQGRGSLNCDTASGYPDANVHANANNENHSFVYLVNTILGDPRVSYYLLDPIGNTFIGSNDHVANGYRRYENVSYPCFTTAGGRRVELREGIWNGTGYSQNLKLINVPVLKHHDTGGSEITASLKHFYGVVSMSDGQSSFRHYSGLGETCGKMMVSVRTPVLNIIDAIWVSHSSLAGYPAQTTFRANQILASQDPVALDYLAAKYILYPIDKNPRHHPTYSGIDQWLTSARDIINGRGGLYHPESGILANQVTKNGWEMFVNVRSVASNNHANILNLVKKYYQDILNRAPESGGAEWWTREIERMASLGIDVKEGFQAVAKFFFNCEEYLLKNKGHSEFVADLYQTFLNRPPDTPGLNFWLDYLNAGLTRDMLITEFANCEEFKLYLESIFSGDTTRPENNLVNDFYRGFLSRLPDTGGFNGWVALMRNAQCTSEQAVSDFSHQISFGFMQSQEYALRNRSHREYVEDLYDGILRRGADLEGFNHWAGLLDNGSYSREQVLQFFIDSPEFQLRIQEVINSGCF